MKDYWKKRNEDSNIWNYRENEMKLFEYNLISVQAAKDKYSEQSIKDLSVAVGYVGPDDTQKLCGDRCLFHIESGKYKDRCTLLAKDVVVPNIASCTYYAKGPAADKWKAVDEVFPANIFTPEQVGLVSGKVQCKRCDRRGNEEGVCEALTSVLKRVMKVNAEFKIEGDGCCNWNKAKGQKELK